MFNLKQKTKSLDVKAVYNKLRCEEIIVRTIFVSSTKTNLRTGLFPYEFIKIVIALNNTISTNLPEVEYPKSKFRRIFSTWRFIPLFCK